MIILSLIGGVVAGLLTFAVSAMMDEDKIIAIIKASVAVLGYLVVRILTPKVPAIVALVVMLPIVLAILGYLVYWWQDDGSWIKELVGFCILEVIFTSLLKVPLQAFYSWSIPKWFGATIRSLPSVICILSIGFFIANRIWFRVQLKGGD